MGAASLKGITCTAAALAALLALSPSVAAGPSQQSTFMDDDLLLYRGTAVAAAALRELRGLGVDTVRVSVHWRAVAPGRRSKRRPRSLTNPANPHRYPRRNWDNYDTLVRLADRLGIRVLFNVTGGAPLWATGKRNGRHVNLQYKPSPTEFERFMISLGRRYSGRFRDENQGRGRIPRVRMWSIWNEPNQGAQLQPQWAPQPGGPKVPYAPHHYRKLYRAAQSGLLRSGHFNDVILIGETAPWGNTQPGLKTHLRPLVFLRELFCLDESLQPLPAFDAEDRGCDFEIRGPLFATGYAHHPYSIVWPPSTPGPHADDVLLGDMSKLERVLDRAGELARIPTGLPIWLTEYGYETNPPDPFRGVSPAEQAAWMASAERLTWANPRVLGHSQFLLLDSLPRERHYARGSRKYWGTFQTGLRWADGQRKPAWLAYRLPFLLDRGEVGGGEAVGMWGMARAGQNGLSQTVRIEFRPSGADQFRPVGGAFSVDDENGYFTASRVAEAGGEWRFAWLEPSGGDWIPSLPVPLAVR